MRTLIALLLLAPLCAQADIAVLGGKSYAGNANENGLAGEITHDLTFAGSDLLTELGVGFTGSQDAIGSFYTATFKVIPQMHFGDITVRFGAGVGLRTWAENIDSSLSSPVNFALSLGVDIGRLRLEAEHQSNAGLHDPNVGQQWLMAGWRFD